jgi:hypothetical protein
MILLLFLMNIIKEVIIFVIFIEYFYNLIVIILNMNMLFKLIFIYILNFIFQNMIIIIDIKFY